MRSVSWSYRIDLRSREEARERPVPADVLLDVPKPPLSPGQIYDMATNLFAVVNELPKTVRIVVFCAKGKRSALGAAMLRQRGYHDVVDAGGVGP
jgi:rhodanese-related sulfurtransferase